MYWEPSQLWKGEDAYVVGGGPSLSTFDWELLRGRNVVGCNSAFILGAGVVGITVFADADWWHNIGKDMLSQYAGIAVACCPILEDARDLPKWLLFMPRQDDGLSHEALGFNGNTGSLAINLALRLGARRVFLLGFDMALGPEGQANWHDVRWEPAKAESYPNFMHRFRAVSYYLPRVFPGCEVVNVSNVSKMDLFPRQTLEEHFGTKKGKVRK